MKDPTGSVSRHRAVVIGAGPSGLAVAYALQGDTQILEKESSVGGLCRSIERTGGVFDIGGHSFHTPHPEVYELVEGLLDGGLENQTRDARVYSHGTLIPYPFQRFFDRIEDPELVRACEVGLREAASTVHRDPPRDFEEFIVRRFGNGIAEHFMLPYNRKLWARDVATISCEWTSERVAAPKGESESFDQMGGRRKPLQPDQTVGYPRAGGFQEIYDALAQQVPSVALNTEIVRVDPFERVAISTDGRAYAWEFLVSTMPLPRLVRVVEGAPPDVVESADRLEYMSLRVELILVGKPLDTRIQRIYCADPDIPPHKIALNHNSSDALRQRNVHAIMAEVSLSSEKEVDEDAIASKTIDFLVDIGVIQTATDVAWTDHLDVRFAYPVYTHSRPQLVRTIKDWMERHDIFSVGRFGDWAYVNSDKCVQRGLDLGRELAARYAPTAKHAD